jgi:hypothetical protein
MSLDTIEKLIEAAAQLESLAQVDHSESKSRNARKLFELALRHEELGME